MDCSKITQDIIAASCDFPSVTGVTGEVVLLNIDEIDPKLTTITKGVLESIVMQTGKKGYRFETFANGISAEVTLVKGTYVSMWTHKLMAKVFLKNQGIKDQIEKLKGGRYVAIVANKDKGEDGDTKYEMYGFYSGLELSEAASNSEDADSVMYSLVLSTNEKSKEPTLPLSVFKTDLTATKAMIDSLLTTISA